MSQAGTIDNGLNPREILKVTGDNSTVATFSGGKLLLYANNAANRNGASVEFENSGSTSFLRLTDTNENTTIGINAGSLTMTGHQNVGIGTTSMQSLTSGNDNTAFGFASLNHATTASGNVSIGYEAHYELVSGTNNIAIGNSAGSNFDGSESYNITIGETGTIGDSHTTVIGHTSVFSGQTRCFIGGIVGNTFSGGQTVIIDPLTDQLGVIAGGSPAIETLTGNTGGPISPSANNINVFGLSGSKTSGSGSTIIVKSPPFSQIGSSATSSLNTGEFVTAAVTRTLPASAGLADGDLFIYVCTTAGALVIQSVGSQKIRLGNVITSAAGSATSTAIGDSLTLRFNATDGFMYTVSSIGNWTLSP